MRRRTAFALVAALLPAAGCAVLAGGAAAVENRIAFFPHPYPLGDWTLDP
jgi:hypothetical protein